MNISPPIYGLVLAGGASSRMGKDKAALVYHDKPQLRWAFELLDSTCAHTFISVRPDQQDEPTRAELPQIIDAHPGIGPIAGIGAALNAHPDKAWLIVACDLPHLSQATLKHLIAHRDTACIATAYRSSYDNLPEPLCAIWEPSARDAVNDWIAIGKQCPRKLLINSNVALLAQPDTRALDNINTPDEFAAARVTMSSSGSGRSQ